MLDDVKKIERAISVLKTLLVLLMIVSAYSLGRAHATIKETAKVITSGFMSYSNEKPSPKERIKMDKIRVYDNKVVIYIDDPKWAVFTDTNSMDPVIDKEAKAIEIDANCGDIQVGDIVSYKSKKFGGIIIHRVIYIGNDSQGKYFIFKGDNNPVEDPERVRCDQLQRVVVGIIY